MSASRIYASIATTARRIGRCLRNRSSVTAAASVAFLLFALGVTIQFMQHWEFEAPYEILNPPEEHATTNAYHYARQYGNRLLVGQMFRIKREVQLEFNRELVLRSMWLDSQQYDQVWLRRQLPPTHVFYRPGVYKVERELPLMTLPPGSYLLLTNVCWEVNFMRRECIDHPELPLEIFSEP